MSTTEWIHCNKCFARYSNNAKFFITGCGHLNCQNCAAKFENNGNKCIICQAPTKAVQLSKNMNHDMLAYFRPLSETLEEFKNILNFQTRNQRGLLKNTFTKYNYAKNEALKGYKMINELKKENARLKMMLRGRPGNSFQTSTPMSQLPEGHSPSLCNSSFISSIPNSPMFEKTPGHAVRMGYSHPSMRSRSDFSQRSVHNSVPVHSAFNGTPLGPMTSIAHLSLGHKSKTFGGM